MEPSADASRAYFGFFAYSDNGPGVSELTWRTIRGPEANVVGKRVQDAFLSKYGSNTLRRVVFTRTRLTLMCSKILINRH